MKLHNLSRFHNLEANKIDSSPLKAFHPSHSTYSSRICKLYNRDINSNNNSKILFLFRSKPFSG
ncbi:hypothetical protein MTR_2g034970 [Medicago truncatula]|uniref:Uncharacterized protein n=1 Tax=Medicago truncatula TaxID=3880 RepID=G7IMX3_MEDTR|nr:hypothetical protein MTR_2g034970 [Medicago truncatula]